MKLKRFIVFVIFVFSFIFLIIPIFFEAFRQIYRSFEILKYEDSLNKLGSFEKNMLNSSLYCRNSKNVVDKFLWDVDGILGYIYIPKFNFYYLIFNQKEDLKYILNFDRPGLIFCGKTFASITLKAKKLDCFDWFNYICKNIRQNDDIFINILGEKKCYKFNNRKIISNFNETICTQFDDGNMSIIFDCPFNTNSYKIVLRAEKTEVKEFENNISIIKVFINNLYIIIVEIIIFLFIILSIIYFIKKIKFFNRKRVKNIKYISGMYEVK